MLSVKYVFHIWQETNGWIVILKTVLKSDLWPGSEKCGFNPKFEDNDLESGCYRVSKLPPLSVKYVCPISHETKHPIMITKIVLKSVLWRGSESARYFCIFQFLCFSLHPTAHSPFHYSLISHISHCQAGSTALYKFKPWSSMTMWPSLGISFRWFLVNLTCVIAVVIQLAHNLRFPDLNCTNFPIPLCFIV